MASMIPQRVPDAVLADLKRAAEVRLFESFRNELPDEYVVLYSVAYQLKEPYERTRDGEADYVLVHPDYGLLVIELKGGRIRYEGSEQQWYSQDRQGVEHPIKDPFAQARTNHYSLRRKLQEAPLTSKYKYPSGYAVCFPDVQIPPTDLRPDAPRAIVLDCNDLKQLKQHISRIFNHWFPQKKGGGPGSDGVRALVDLIGHSWQFRSPLRESIIAEVRQTDEYTEQQFMLLDHLQRFRRLLVCGCAGSGKTFLAVEKARRLKQEGFSVVLICWNENLAKWLQKRLHPMDIEVNHFNQFARSVIQRARNLGADIPPRYFPTMDDLLHSFLAGVERYDAIIVDEGQDFDKYPWRFVMKMLREDGILYIFYDDNQRVYRKHGRFPIQGPPVVLTTNCRNTKEIHDLAGRFYASDHPTTCLLKSGRQPELIVCEPDERTAMARVLDKLVNKENIEPEQIVILTPLADPNTQWEDGTRVGTFEIVRSLFKPGASNRSIRCSTIGAFKGLEREVVILAELDKSPKLHKNHMLYVGLSRARSHLIVLLRKEENRKWFKELLR